MVRTLIGQVVYLGVDSGGDAHFNLSSQVPYICQSDDGLAHTSLSGWCSTVPHEKKAQTSSVLKWPSRQGNIVKCQCKQS